MPQHPTALQLRAGGDRRGGARCGAAVRAQGERFHQAVGGQRGPFERAIEAIAATTGELLSELVTTAPTRDREVEAAKAKARSAKRFAARESAI